LTSTIACCVRGEIVTRASDTCLVAVEHHSLDPHAGPPHDAQRARGARPHNERAVEVRQQPDRATRARELGDRGLELSVVPYTDHLARGRLGCSVAASTTMLSNAGATDRVVLIRRR
jgi:hypothetical protein